MRIPLVLSLLIANASFAQQAFPTLQGETADGKTVTLPNPSAKGYTVMGLAYSQKAQAALEGWFEPAYMRFVSKHGLFANAYQCEVYFVPLFTGLDKAAYEPSMKRFRKSAEAEVVEHVIFCKAEREEIKEALGLEKKDVPYFFVLDKAGRILHREQGPFTEDKLEALEEIMLR